MVGQIKHDLNRYRHTHTHNTPTHIKKQKNLTHNQEENQSLETNLEMTEMMD